MERRIPPWRNPVREPRPPTNFPVALRALTVGFLLVLGCSGSSDSSDLTATKTCAPGDTRACTTPGGESGGKQACKADGSGYEELCEVPATCSNAKENFLDCGGLGYPTKWTSQACMACRTTTAVDNCANDFGRGECAPETLKPCEAACATDKDCFCKCISGFVPPQGTEKECVAVGPLMTSVRKDCKSACYD